MKDNLNEKDIFSVFKYILNFLNEKNLFKDKNLLLSYKFYEKYKYDDLLFFKSGQLLFLFYIFNINYLERNKIKYNNNIFYVLDLFNSEYLIEDLSIYDCESIAWDFINHSAYNINFLPVEVTYITNNQILEIQSGFRLAYDILLKEKIDILNTLESSENTIFFTNLIKNLKLLNQNDLDKQLKFINIRYKNQYNLENPLSNDYLEYHEFIKSQKKFTPNLIQNAIIGIDNGDFAVTWMGFIENKVIPLGYRNIYIALYLGYLSNNIDNKHYLQSCIQAVNTSIKDFNLNKKKLLKPSKKIELSKILYVFYILNKLISYERLNSFILENKSLFTSYILEDPTIQNFESKKFIDDYLRPMVLPLMNRLFIIKIN